jgi:hypothetical protein
LILQVDHGAQHNRVIAAAHQHSRAVKTHTVTTSMTVETPLPCEWAIPASPAGQTFDREKVNVQLRSPTAGETKFGKVEQMTQCARNGWYYDDLP